MRFLNRLMPGTQRALIFLCIIMLATAIAGCANFPILPGSNNDQDNSASENSAPGSSSYDQPSADSFDDDSHEGFLVYAIFSQIGIYGCMRTVM